MGILTTAGAFSIVAANDANAATPVATSVGPPGASFWSVPTQVAAGAKAGDIYWAQERRDPPAGGKAWNLIYVSEVMPGKLSYVSGEIYVPTATTAAERDVVLWNHPTAGNSDNCAPSRRDLKSIAGDSRVPAIEGLLAKGYVVVMSDYPGVGVPGPTYYMAGEPNARASLDALKAAQNVPEAKASKRYVMYGWSQGGQTTLWAGAIGKTYAADFQPLGSAMIAPAGRILDLTLNSMTSLSLAGYVVMTLPGIRTLFPTLNYGDFLTVEGLEQFPAMTDGCFEVFAAAAKVKSPYQPNALVPGSPWYVAMQKVDSFTSVNHIPVLIFQGAIDADTPVKLTAKLRGDLCAAGAMVDYRESAGLNHRNIVPAAVAALPDWIEDRFKGVPATSNCGK